jgi:hypothetical protein
MLAFNITNPYGPTNGAGLDHATEAGLAALALLIAITMVMLTRSFMAVLIILLNVFAILISGAMFLLQTLRDIQPSPLAFPQISAPSASLTVTYGLMAAGIVSLLWLFRRPFTWGDRCWVFLFFAAVSAAAYFQSQYQENDITRHLLLLGALITLIQGILMAGQMERQRR